MLHSVCVSRTHFSISVDTEFPIGLKFHLSPATGLSLLQFHLSFLINVQYSGSCTPVSNGGILLCRFCLWTQEHFTVRISEVSFLLNLSYQNSDCKCIFLTLTKSCKSRKQGFVLLILR